MKKNTISVDFVLFGDTEDDSNEKKLRAFNEAVKGGEGSNLVVIPPSGKLLSDQLLSTPLLLGDNMPSGSGGGGGGDAGGAGGDFNEFGFDPSSDPELALALRMSMEEERARQEKKAKEEAAKKPELETVKEGDESQPLLNKDGEASGSGSKEDKKEDDKDGDKMETD